MTMDYGVMPVGGGSPPLIAGASTVAVQNDGLGHADAGDLHTDTTSLSMTTRSATVAIRRNRDNTPTVTMSVVSQTTTEIYECRIRDLEVEDLWEYLRTRPEDHQRELANIREDHLRAIADIREAWRRGCFSLFCY